MTAVLEIGLQVRVVFDLRDKGDSWELALIVEEEAPWLALLIGYCALLQGSRVLSVQIGRCEVRQNATKRRDSSRLRAWDTALRNAHAQETIHVRSRHIGRRGVLGVHLRDRPLWKGLYSNELETGLSIRGNSAIYRGCTSSRARTLRLRTTTRWIQRFRRSLSELRYRGQIGKRLPIWSHPKIRRESCRTMTVRNPKRKQFPI